MDNSVTVSQVGGQPFQRKVAATYMRAGTSKGCSFMSPICQLSVSKPVISEISFTACDW